MEAMPAKPLSWREAFLTGLIMLGLAVVFCGPSLVLNPELTPFDNGDPVASYLPYAIRTWQPVSPESAGAWDATLWTGLPESHSPFGRYYPPAWLLFELLPLGMALSWTYVFHHALAGLGTYVLLRSGGFGRGAAWIGSFVFGFAGFMVFHRPFVPMFQTAAWLPWIVWAFEQFRRRESWFWVMTAGTLMAMHALAAHAQTIVMGAMVWLMYAAYFAVFDRQSLGSRTRFLMGVGTACVLGVVGSLPQLLPMMEVGSWTPYTEPNFGYYSSGALELRCLGTLAGPWMLGGWFGASAAPGLPAVDGGCYVGLIPLALGVIGLVAAVSLLRTKSPAPLKNPYAATVQPTEAPAWRPSRAEAGFWLLLGVVHVLLMLGRMSPLHRALYVVPVYNMFHVPARHAWVVSLVIAWLAALGWERMRQATLEEGRTLLRRMAIVLGLLIAGCVLILSTWTDWLGHPDWRYPGLWLSLGVAVGVLLLLAGALRSQTGRALWLFLLLLAAFADVKLALGDFYLSPISTEQARSPQHFPEFVQHLRSFSGDRVPTRVLMAQGCWRSDVPKCDAPAAWGQTWGLGVLNCYSQSMPRSLAQLLRLDKYGNVHFNRVLWEERGLSAVGGRFFVVPDAPYPTVPGLGFVEHKREDIWPGGPLKLSAVPGQTQRHQATVFVYAADSYLVEGEIQAKDPVGQAASLAFPMGKIELQIIDGFSGEGLAIVRPGSEATPGGRCTFARFVKPPRPRDRLVPIEVRLECSGATDASLVSLNLWNLRFKPAPRSTDPPPDLEDSEARILARLLREGQHSSYRLRVPGKPAIWENPHARSLATLVHEIRGADDDMDAAQKTLAATDRPVTELAHVAASRGKSHDLDLASPRRLTPGTVVVQPPYRPDNIQLTTSTPGEGFLVLAVTRCRGWTATIDGQPAPIHAVDGPLMGVRVPAGVHEVRFQFRPVLVTRGLWIAGIAFAAAWGICLLLWKRRRASTGPATPSPDKPPA